MTVAKLLDQHRRALNLLAGLPNGCTTPFLLARGIRLESMSELADSGLVSTEMELAGGTNYPSEVTRVHITEAGRQALTKFR
jgi:hypothetical protein